MTVKRLHKIKESSIEAELVKRVQAAGGLCEKTTVIGCRGFFDRLIILPGGRIIFAECKRPRGGKMSPHQQQRHIDYKSRGARLEIISSLEDIDRLLAKK